MVGGGIGVLVGGIAVFSAGIIPGVIYLAFIGGMGWIFWVAMFRGMVENSRLQTIGEDAEATILSIAENGTSMQMGGSVPSPGVTINLQVRPKGKSPYSATLKTFISVFDIPNYRQGASIQVKFDPADPQKVTIPK